MTAMAMRGLIVKGVVLAVDDTGDVQTLTVQTHDGVVRSDIEVYSPHGSASNVSVGATTLLMAIEGDQGHYVAMPPMALGARYGNLPEGGAGTVDHANNRIVFPGDGTGLLAVAALLRMMGATIVIQSQGGTTFRGPVVFEDAVTFQSHVTFEKGVGVGGDLTVGGNISAGGTVSHG